MGDLGAMKTLWQDDARKQLEGRLARLAPDRVALWGRMSAPQMVCHLAESMKMALGDLTVAPKRLPIRYPPLKQLIVYIAPFPKNVPTAPELLARAPCDWSADVADLRVLIDRFAARGRDTAWPVHPAFGTLSGRAWGVLAYRHIDHHFRQFGGLTVDEKRALLRHTVATVAYRGGKAVRGAPPSFAAYTPDGSPRTAARILAHIGDLFDWALSQAQGAEAWTDSVAARMGAGGGTFFRDAAAVRRLSRDRRAARGSGRTPLPGGDRRRADAHRSARR